MKPHMTDKKSRRVVIINNIKSDTIDQAIFILKSNAKECSGGISTTVAQEAQDIINNYMRQVEMIKSGSVTKRNNAKVNGAFPILLSLLSALCIGLSAALFYYIG